MLGVRGEAARGDIKAARCIGFHNGDVKAGNRRGFGRRCVERVGAMRHVFAPALRRHKLRRGRDDGMAETFQHRRDFIDEGREGQ